MTHLLALDPAHRLAHFPDICCKMGIRDPPPVAHSAACDAGTDYTPSGSKADPRDHHSRESSRGTHLGSMKHRSGGS